MPNTAPIAAAPRTVSVRRHPDRDARGASTVPVVSGGRTEPSGEPGPESLGLHVGGGG
ncbi:MAG: hypothetical protein R3320_06845 [Nitriliruptorales bacterium]|nr:hypothetical protein [Nitriliruptorales bacterium]